MYYMAMIVCAHDPNILLRTNPERSCLMAVQKLYCKLSEKVLLKLGDANSKCDKSTAIARSNTICLELSFKAREFENPADHRGLW